LDKKRHLQGAVVLGTWPDKKAKVCTPGLSKWAATSAGLAGVTPAIRSLACLPLWGHVLDLIDALLRLHLEGALVHKSLHHMPMPDLDKAQACAGAAPQRCHIALTAGFAAGASQ
jgi:hypothetical protein